MWFGIKSSEKSCSKQRRKFLIYIFTLCKDDVGHTPASAECHCPLRDLMSLNKICICFVKLTLL